MREYTDAEVEAMSKAFDLVKDGEHWKNPIDKTLELTDEQRRITEDAIIFYAGCVPTITKVAGGKYRVRAVGYYNAVGA
jgi:hypothetical protein